MPELELSHRVFEDNLTGDPFKQGFEAKRNPTQASIVKSREKYT